MGKAIIYMVLSALAVFVAPGLVSAQDAKPTAPLALVEDPPARYVVVKGDTLWDISARFLRDPWRWPDIWGLNRDEIKNPHWIYPGDVIILDFTGGTPRLRFEGDTSASGWILLRERLSPQVRTSPLDATPVSTIPTSLLKAFTSKALIVDEKQLEIAPRIISGHEGRVILGPGDIAYARDLNAPIGTHHFAVRPGRTFVDPDTKEVLGHEAIFLGETNVREAADISTLKIRGAVREINPGDQLLIASESPELPFMPRPPARSIRGKVIGAGNETVSEIGPLTVVILNRGLREGIEIGNVLSLSRAGDVVRPAGAANNREVIQLPDERYGLVFVFRVYEKLAYGLVMNTSRSVQVGDFVLNPK